MIDPLTRDELIAAKASVRLALELYGDNLEVDQTLDLLSAWNGLEAQLAAIDDRPRLNFEGQPIPPAFQSGPEN